MGRAQLLGGDVNAHLDAVAEPDALGDELGQASLDQAKASVRQAEQDRYATSEQLTQARVAQAKAQGELEAYKTELASRMIQTTDVRPTTRPTGLMARLASAFAD